MKVNKWGIRISLIITILSLFGAIFLKDWWQNLSFAILGSAFLSFTICIVNFITLRKQLVDEIVIDAYKINCFGFSALFSINRNMKLEKAVQVLNVIDDRYYSVYVKISELFLGLFWFDCRRKIVNQIKNRIDNDLVKIYQIDSFIEIYQNEANNKTKKIYDDLDKFIDDNSLYLEILKMAKIFKSNVSSLEEIIDKNELKKECADKYKKTLK